MKNRPEKVNILGIDYAVLYCDKPSDVDVHRRESLWGQIDYWTRSIRVYDDGTRLPADLWETILHEVLHGIGDGLKLDKFSGKDCDDDMVDILALALTDVLVRNGWLDKGLLEV